VLFILSSFKLVLLSTVTVLFTLTDTMEALLNVTVESLATHVGIMGDGEGVPDSTKSQRLKMQVSVAFFCDALYFFLIWVSAGHTSIQARTLAGKNPPVRIIVTDYCPRSVP